MQSKTEAEQFWFFAKEAILKVLQILDSKLKNFQSLDDYDGVKKIENELIPKYEKLFQELDLDFDKHLDFNTLDKFKNIIMDITKQFNLDEDYIQSESKKRKELGRNSGSEVVKKFFEYQIKELEKKRDSLLDMAESLIKKEEDLSIELSEVIQEEEEQRCLEQLTTVSKRLNALNEKLDTLKNQIDFLEHVLKTKWRYEIFGTVSREDMLKAYKETNTER